MILSSGEKALELDHLFDFILSVGHSGVEGQVGLLEGKAVRYDLLYIDGAAGDGRDGGGIEIPVTEYGFDGDLFHHNLIKIIVYHALGGHTHQTDSSAGLHVEGGLLDRGDGARCLKDEVVKDDPTFAETQYYAVDANPDALLRIKAGQQTATVMQDTQELAQKNLDAAYQLLTGEKDMVEETIETILITEENVDEYIEKYIEIGIITQEEYDAVK